MFQNQQKFFQNIYQLHELKKQAFINKPVYFGLSIQSKRSIFLHWTALQSILKQKTLTQTIQIMLKQNQMLQIMNQIDHYRKNRKHNWINERRIKWEKDRKACYLERQPYSCLTENKDKDKKAKDSKKCFMKPQNCNTNKNNQPVRKSLVICATQLAGGLILT